MISCGSFSSRCFRRGPMKTPGPRPVPDRRCGQGILYVLHTGIGWEDLPQELGFRSDMTCWRRIKWWINAGAFDDLHRTLLAQLNAENEIDWSRAVIDGSYIDTKKGVPDLEFAPISSAATQGSPLVELGEENRWGGAWESATIVGWVHWMQWQAELLAGPPWRSDPAAPRWSR